MIVNVEILPWLSTMIRPESTGKLTLEHDLRGNTLRDLLRELAEADPEIARVIFDLDARELRYPALGVLNDKLLEFAGGLDVELHESDCVTLMAAYTGGQRVRRGGRQA